MSISDDVSRTSSSLWTTVSGEVAHPDSPRGGGGPGRFVGSGPLGAERMVGAAQTKSRSTGRVKVSVTVQRPTVSTFTIDGRTLAEAKQALDRRAEWGLYAATQNFTSSARVDGTGKILSVTMELHPVIQLPAWSGYGSATRNQQASWDAMYRALQAHENNHHQIQLDCVETLKHELAAATRLDADTLNALIEKLQTSAQDKQDAYDRSSDHGATEGVVLKVDA